MTHLGKFTCSQCGRASSLDPALIGGRVRCPHCEQIVTVNSVMFGESGDEVPQRSAVETISIPLELATSLQESSNDRRTESSLGSNFGRFELRQTLGQGAFGRVFRAYDPLLDRDVALKVPRFDASDEVRVRRFLNESKAAARLRHPNLVAVFESGQVDETLYIAAEFVDGETLTHRAARAWPTYEEIAEWVAELAEALAYAHSEGVVHRDIKPDNIMINAKGRPQILDFGLAKREQQDSLATADGNILGTPAYMSPEQARGDVSLVGPASDQYSLGVVLYELLAHQRPFDGPPHRVLHAVISEEPVPPRRLAPDVPRDLDAVCLKALEKDPSRRYADASALARDLRHWLSGEPVLARPISWRERGWRWCRRNPGIAGTACVAVAALLLAVAISIRFAIYQTHVATEALAKQQQIEEAQRKIDESEQVVEARTQEAHTAGKTANLERQRAQQKTTEAESALTEAELARNATKAERQQTLEQTKVAARQLTETYLRRGLQASDDGDSARGLIWFAEAWDAAGKADASDLSRVARTNIATRSPKLVTLEACLQDTHRISEICYSPAVNWLATLSRPLTGEPTENGEKQNGAITLWNIREGWQRGPPLEVPGTLALKLDSDGHLLAFARSSDGRGVTAFRAHDGQERFGPIDQDARVETVLINPVSNTFLTANVWRSSASSAKVEPPGAVSEWSGKLGAGISTIVYSLPNVRFTTTGSKPVVVLSPNGQFLATNLRRGQGKIDLFDLKLHRKIAVTIETSDSVRALAVSSQRNIVAVGHESGVIELWDGFTGDRIGSRLRHDSVVSSLAISPSGEWLASGSHDQTARLWELKSGRSVGGLLRHVDRVNCVAFSPDEKFLFSGGDDETLKVWKLPQPDAVAEENRAAAKFIQVGPRYSHGGKTWRLAVSDRGEVFRSRETRTSSLQPEGTPVAQFRHVRVTLGTSSSLFVCAEDRCAVLRKGTDDRWEEIKWPAPNDVFSADLREQMSEQILVTSNRRGTVQVWDMTASPPKELRSFSAGAGLNCVKLTPDGKSVITAHEEGTIRTWPWGTGRAIAGSLSNPTEPLSLDISKDGKTLLVGARDTAHVWDLKTSTLLRSFVQNPAPVTQVRLTADGKRAVLVSDTISVWSVNSAKRLGSYTPLSRVVSVELIASDPAPVVRFVTDTLSGDRLIDTGTADVPTSARYTCAAIAPDGQSAALGSETHATVRIIHNGRRPPKELEFAFIGEKPGNYDPGGSLAVMFTSDGKEVIAAPWSYFYFGTTSWDVSTGVQSAQPIAAMAPGNNFGRVKYLVPSANSQQFFWGTESGIRPIDRKTAKPQSEWLTHQDVSSASISSDGRFLATGGRDHFVRIWQLDSGQLVGKFSHTSPVTSVSLSHDGRVVAVGSADRNCTLWEIKSRQPLCEPLHHPAAVKHVVLAPNAQSVATADEGQRIRIWDVSTGFPLGPDLECTAEVLAIAFTPDGNEIVSVTDDGQLRSSRYFQRYRGSANRSRMEIERATGLTIDGRGVISVLTPAAWNDRQAQLGPQR